MPIYAREGVRYVWLVDPVKRTLEAYEISDEHAAGLECAILAIAEGGSFAALGGLLGLSSG
jgi:hypothetical protein